MNRLNLLFPLAFLLLLSQGVNAQTVSITGGDNTTVSTTQADYSCGPNNSGFNVGDPALSTEDPAAAIVLTFSSPVTTVRLPFAGLDDGSTGRHIIDAVGVDETVTPGCSNISVSNEPSGKEITGSFSTFGFGELEITATTPFTQLTITRESSNDEMLIPRAAFLNAYPGFVGDYDPAANGTGSADIVTISGGDPETNAVSDYIEACGPNNSGFDIGDQGFSTSNNDVTIILNFNSPVTTVRLPYASFGGGTSDPHIIDAIGVDETITGGCNDVDVDSRLPFDGKEVSELGSNEPLFGELLITTTEPFTQLSITRTSPNDDIIIPRAAFLNAYPGFVGDYAPTANGTGSTDPVTTSGGENATATDFDSACGANPSGFSAGDQGLATDDDDDATTIILNFNSPVTEVRLPYTSFGGGTSDPHIIDAIGVDETITGGCNDVRVEGRLPFDGKRVSETGSNTVLFGEFLITSTEPFTQLSITRFSPNDDIIIPRATFLNTYPGLLTFAIFDDDGDGIPNDSEVAGEENDPCLPAQSVGYTGFDASNAIWAGADCDNDGVANGMDCGPYDSGNNGTLNTAPGTYNSNTTVAGDPTAAGGAADGTFTGNLAGTDNLTLTYPAAEIGSEICVTLGFNNAAGTAVLTLNGTATNFNNGTGNTSYAAQEFCVTTTTAGPHTLVITETGGGNIQVDGSVLTECLLPADADNDGVPDANDNCPGTPMGTIVDATGCPDTDGDGTVGIADPDGSDPCNPDPNDPACNAANCNAGTAAPQFQNN
jgi:hypothetical protein